MAKQQRLSVQPLGALARAYQAAYNSLRERLPEDAPDFLVRQDAADIAWDEVSHPDDRESACDALRKLYGAAHRRGIM